MQYTATNTSLQVIDTFDPPVDKMIYCQIHAVDHTTSSQTILVINHNGIVTSETQESTSVDDTVPAEFIVNIVDHVGEISVTPSTAPTTYTISKTVIESEFYSENTVSGKNIKSAEGYGLYLVGSANNISIRQSDNNFFGSFNDTTSGPLTTKLELFDATSLISYNYCQLSAQDDYNIFISSDINNSHAYVELSVTPGLTYRVTANAYYTFETNTGRTDTFDKGSRINVGSEIGIFDLNQAILTDTEDTYVLDFVPTTSTIYVSFGHGVLGTKVFARDISIKELVPFHTYNQLEGTVYVKWNTVAAGSDILNIGNNSVSIDASNNIFINTANVGAQQTSNRLAYTYTSTNVAYTLNGSTSVSESCEYYSNATVMSIGSIDEFSYMSEHVDDITLTGLTDG